MHRIESDPTRLLWRVIVCVFLPAAVVGPLHAAEIPVSTGGELAGAMQQALPGDSIVLAPGSYLSASGFGTSEGALRGSAHSPITIRSRFANDPATVEGGFYLPGASWLVLRDLRIVNPSFHGINADNNGGGLGQAGNLVFDGLHILGDPTKAGSAGIKLSHVDEVTIRNCRFERWAQSAIDGVGAFGGSIEGNSFIGDDAPNSFAAIQLKGGSKDIKIRNNYLRFTGRRSIQIGGATGANFMRPADAQFEALDIEVVGNRIVGGDACFTISTQNGSQIRNNICYLPALWTMRLLHENPLMLSNRNAEVVHNLFVYDGVSMDAGWSFVNIGSMTDLETFVFDGNAYFQTDGDSPRYPVSPTTDANLIDQIDPELISPGASEMSIGSTNPVFADIFYVGNQPPVAEAITVETIAATANVVLAGNDPEGEDLLFSIVDSPANGFLGPLAPVVPAPLPDREGVGAIQPPIQSAIVQYTAADAGGPDSFKYSVTDTEGQVGLGTVQINPVEPSSTPSPVTAVVAADGEYDIRKGMAKRLRLRASAPAGTELAYRLISLPTGGVVSDDVGTPVGTSIDLLSPHLVFTPNQGFEGTASFNYSVRDRLTSAQPCLVPSCDTGTVTIEVSPSAEKAIPVSVSTPRGQPVQVVLAGHFDSSGSAQATLELQSSVAGRVADSNSDGEGDAADALPGSSPLSGAPASGVPGPGPLSGTLRFFMKFDVGSLPLPTGVPLSGTLRLSTDAPAGNGGAQDSDGYNQNACVATAGLELRSGPVQDAGRLVPSDFEAFSEQPLPFHVTPAICAPGQGTVVVPISAISVQPSVLGVEVRIDGESLANSPAGPRIYTSATSNLALNRAPALTVEIAAGAVFPLQFRLLTVPPPNHGQLTFGGEPVTIGQTFALAPSLLFTPAPGFVGTSSFEFEAFQGSDSDVATATVVVEAGDNCLASGRDPGCAP